jgi:hypothetical protein
MYRYGTVNQPVHYHVGHEIRFDERPRPGSYELRYSKRGHPFYAWKKPVPRIDDMMLDCVVYLYPSVEDAEAGYRVGGSGFLVGIPSEIHEGYVTLYAVTNSHVIRGDNPVIRLNTKKGDKDVLPFNTEDWVHHEDGDELAVCPLVIAPGVYKYKYIPLSLFVTPELVEQHNIGPGDDVFMVGRFVSHEGQQRNTPLARFGNISMMPWEPIPTKWGPAQDSFLVEVRSLSGFSGSPVFVDIRPFTTRPSSDPETLDVVTEPLGSPWLLGVDWGHPSFHQPVKQREGEQWVDVPEGWAVEVNSGQAAVLPAWRLQHLLNQEELVMARKRADGELTKRKGSSPVTLDMRGSDVRRQPDGDDENPEAFTRDNFFRE